MKFVKTLAFLAAATALTACEDQILARGIGPDKGEDRGIDRKDLSQLVAGIWVDPTGCDHWIIDDGVEGYLSARLDDYGNPVCSGAAPPTVATGSFKDGSAIRDPL